MCIPAQHIIFFVHLCNNIWKRFTVSIASIAPRRNETFLKSSVNSEARTNEGSIDFHLVYLNYLCLWKHIATTYYLRLGRCLGTFTVYGNRFPPYVPHDKIPTRDGSHD